MILIKAVAVFLVNFILYATFGSFFGISKKEKWSLTVTVMIGFFAYYALFALVCLPIMFTYSPLSLLAHCWIVPCVAVPFASFVIYRKEWAVKIRELVGTIAHEKYFWITIVAVTAASAALTAITYNFTLDAAYYVANVTTNVDTNMINVYDAFTGSWQDHFELRYVFATYYAADSVVCCLTGLPALIETKIVMSVTVMVIVNMLYVLLCRQFFKEHASALLMYVLMVAVNFLFISNYTTSNFLMTRTYEGKTVVGNISLIAIFILYMMMVSEGPKRGSFLKLFIVSLGTATVSSTANMVIPAEICILFVPYAICHKKPGMLPKILLCIVPELVMMLVYVLYVKGYYAVYTFPR